MARIRTIKPEFFTSEDITALTPLARLLYVGLWCEADREGRLEWKPRTFKMRYLPADNCDIDELCQEILAFGLVIKYGNGLAYIPKFLKHQQINNREQESRLPEPEQVDASGTRQARVKDDAEGKGKEGKGKERNISPDSDESGNSRAKPKPADLDFSDWPQVPSPEVLAEWLDLRKRKRAKVTPLVVKTMANQLRIAASAGWTVDECLATAVARGWQGFQAEWLPQRPNAPPGGDHKPPSVTADFRGKRYEGTPEHELPDFLR